MDIEKKIPVYINDEIHEYSENTTLENVARDFQNSFPHRIILARVNGKLKELTNVNKAYPVTCGSALKGEGVEELLEDILKGR